MNNEDDVFHFGPFGGVREHAVSKSCKAFPQPLKPRNWNRSRNSSSRNVAQFAVQTAQTRLNNNKMSYFNQTISTFSHSKRCRYQYLLARVEHRAVVVRRISASDLKPEHQHFAEDIERPDMQTRISRLAILLPAVLSLTFASGQALSADTTSVTAQIVENSEERINFSGKLRMLSQRIPAAACHLNRGIDPEGSSALLVGAAAEFEKILLALEFGDADLNVQEPETRRKTLAAIAELRSHWEPLKAAATAIAEGTSTSEDMDFILTQNLPVLARAQLLVEELVKQYSNPNAVTRASLMLIDISGRQRMLTQKMSKETCMLGTDYATPSTVDDLQGTMRIFEASLEALTFGMPAVGIGPPPNPEIFAGLGGVQSDWSSVKPHVLAVIEGEDLDDASNTEKFQGLNVTMANMNRVVGMYTASVK